MLVFSFFLLLSLKQYAVVAADDYENILGGYTFVHHHDHNLLLVMKNDVCYYINTTWMQTNALDFALRNKTESALITALERNSTGQVMQSTLLQMRDTYKDLLADFHCLTATHIYQVQDDILPPPPGSLRALISELQCDFEDGYCGWVQGTTDQLNWGLNKGRTSEHNTGPESDHTHHNDRGEYAYFNSSLGYHGDSAELVSPFLPIASSLCLRFWYTMYGQDVNRLAVYLRNIDGSLTLAWNITGDQGPDWKETNVTLDPKISSQTQIAIRATRSGGNRGDIAIDDVNLTQGPCPSSGSTATPDQHLATAREPAVQDLTCDFEDGYCGWTQSKTDHADWDLNKGELNHGYGSGPSSDHTMQTDAGEYTYIDSSQPPHNAKADFLSPFLWLTSPVCLEFWYNMYGWTINKLAVLAKTIQGQEIELWSLTGDQGQGWKEAKVNVTSTHGDGQLQMIIRGYKGNSTAGDIAIDDITANAGYC